MIICPTWWSMKYNSAQLALGLLTPETATLHVVAPGASAGGAGVEGGTPTTHFVTFAGQLTDSPAETMNRLQTTLNRNKPVEVRVYAIQTR